MVDSPAGTCPMPSIRWNTATRARAANAAASQSVEPGTGISNRTGPKATGATSRQTTWMANQTARFRITPTTAAVTAVRAEESAALALRPSMKGAPRTIPAKVGAKVTKVVRGGGAGRAREERFGPTGSAEGPHVAHEWQHHDQRPRRRFGHADSIQHFAGLSLKVIRDLAANSPILGFPRLTDAPTICLGCSWP